MGVKKYPSIHLINVIRVAFISTIQPETHYSRYLLTAMEEQKHDNIELHLYANKDSRNHKTPPKLLHWKPVWNKGTRFPFDILKELYRDHINMVHMQHEFNMYGGILSAILFPIVLIVLRVLHIKSIVTLHAVVTPQDIDNEFIITFSFPRIIFIKKIVRAFFWYLYHTTIIFSNSIIVHSEYAKKQLIYSYSANEQKITIIPIGVPSKVTKIISPSQRIRKMVHNEKKMFLFFGYLLKRKGLTYLIRAFKQLVMHHPETKLIIAGGVLPYQKEYENTLKHLVKKYNLKNKIIFTSFLSQKDIEFLYAHAYCIVLPYTQSISSSLPLSFAIQWHVPTIISNIGALCEEIRNNKEGLYCKPKSTKSLAKAMDLLLTNEKLHAKLVKGMIKLSAHRSWDNAAKKTLKLYKHVYKP